MLNDIMEAFKSKFQLLNASNKLRASLKAEVFKGSLQFNLLSFN